MPGSKRSRRVDSPSIFCFHPTRKTCGNFEKFGDFHRIWQDFQWFWSRFCSLLVVLSHFGAFLVTRKNFVRFMYFFPSPITTKILLLRCVYARKWVALLFLNIFNFHRFWIFWFFCYNVTRYRFSSQKSMKTIDFHWFSLIFDLEIDTSSHYTKKMKKSKSVEIKNI